MEGESTNKKIIIDAIVTSLISSLILLIINSGVYWFTKEKINITVTPSSYINNEYVTVISLKNFQNNKSISDINLWFDNVIIKNADTDLKNVVNKDNIKINDISPDYTGNIIIHSEKEVTEQSLKIELKEKCNLIFTGFQKESAYIQIINYLGTALIYFIEFAIMLYISNTINNKKIEKLEKKIEGEEKVLKLLEQNQEISEKKAKELQKRVMKNKLLLERKISDYSRELNFWKDTIRKVLYGFSKDETKKKDICEIVTNNLKTYRTKEKCKYSELEDLIEDIKENEEEE